MTLRGYTGRILCIDLTSRRSEVESPGDAFYRTYLGGSAMGTYYLLKCTPADADALGPENTLTLMTGVVTGAPFSGQSRVTATAKSPLRVRGQVFFLGVYLNLKALGIASCDSP